MNALPPQQVAGKEEIKDRLSGKKVTFDNASGTLSVDGKPIVSNPDAIRLRAQDLSGPFNLIPKNLTTVCVEPTQDKAIEVFAVSNLEELKKLLAYLSELGHYAQKIAISNNAKDNHLDEINRAKCEQIIKDNMASLETFRAKRSEQSFMPTSVERSFSEVIGQAEAKRGLEIAAAGRQHVLMIGPPGCGKSMLAKRFINLLPALSFNTRISGLPTRQ